MFSIIVCSVFPEKAEQLKENIAKTIGCPHEVIVLDNRNENRPLAEVYNRGINAAKYPLLMFVHEDVLFRTSGWGTVLVGKLAEPDCGVIGFAGCRAMAAACSGWSQGDKYDAWHYFDHEKLCHQNVVGDFTPVVAVDGFAFCVRRDVAKIHPFDAKMLTGFHCYDVDFCLGIHKSFINYVCSAVDVAHYSFGNYNRQWFEITLNLYQNKWKPLLPACADVSLPTDADTEYVASRFLYRVLRINELPIKTMWKMYKAFCAGYALSSVHVSHIFQHGLKFLRNVM